MKIANGGRSPPPILSPTFIFITTMSNLSSNQPITPGVPYRLVRLEQGFDLSTLLEEPNWDPNSMKGYRRHQKVLVAFIEFCLEQGWIVDLPIFAEDAGWDYGIDVFVNGKAIDLKSFGLREDAKTKTFDSPAYAGKGAHPKSLTEWLVFAPTGSSADTWEAAPFKRQQKSYKGYAPFFWKNDVISFSEFASTL